MNNYDKERKYVSKRLKAIRTQLGITQADMAKLLGIKRAAYTRYETGMNVAPSDKYVRVVNLIKGYNHENDI